MIAPSIRIQDVDDGGFAVLEEHVSRRDLGAGPQLHVLHESGEVLSVVHTRRGPLPGPHPRLDDLAAEARRLRDEHKVDRVVLLDGDLFDPSEDPALVHVPQPTLFATLTERFWSSPGVVTDPPPVGSSWPELAARLLELGSGYLLLVVTQDATPVVRLQGELRHGLLVGITTLDLDAAPSPVLLELVLTTAELDALLEAPDVAGALLARPELS